ncbi:type II transmembrane C-type lectin isoform X1 [Hydra vulgaris]|uniref:Type II transmembrane C-type lectin isoform X1 n=1 Tax=Hydra vulgaris TaxID=6087 RepID=A0ABM4CXF2_HYDVU
MKSKISSVIYIVFNYILFFFISRTVAQEYPCDSEEWKYYQGYCYWSSLYHQSPLHHRSNWFNAARECRKRNSDLASIQNPGENHMVFTLNRCADAWVGLVMIDSNLKTSQAGWEWFDNSQRNFANWLPQHPLRDHYECSSLYNVNGQWINSIHCGNARNYYVCKKQATGSGFVNITTEFHKLRGPCDDGWFALGEKCYHVNPAKVDYFEAMIQCQSMKGQLVSIHNSKEDADLTRIFDACETPWIGLENTDPNKVGENSGWKWSDGTLIDYHNWKDGGITKDQTKQCGMLQRGAKWENVPCWELHPFVCEKPKPKTI